MDKTITVILPDNLIDEYKESMKKYDFSYIDLRFHFNKETMKVEKITTATGENPYFAELEFSEDDRERIAASKSIRECIEEKEMSRKLGNCLLRAGFHVLNDIRNFPKKKFSIIRHFGPKCWDELDGFCSKNGIELQDNNLAPVYKPDDTVVLLNDREGLGYNAEMFKAGTILTVIEKLEDNSPLAFRTAVPLYMCCRNSHKGFLEKVVCSPGELKLLKRGNANER